MNRPQHYNHHNSNQPPQKENHHRKMEPEQQRWVGELQQRNEQKRGGTQKQVIPRPGRSSHWNNKENSRKNENKNRQRTQAKWCKNKGSQGDQKKKKATYQKLLKKTSQRKKALTEYIESRKNLRTAIEEHENKKTEEKTEQITNMAKINPNTIWNTRKRTRTDNELSYKTITEERTTITDPEKTK